ncbi:WD repeat protein [Trichophyton tonsurans CBS 112818]|uniref:WD repeat protein n=2 Tax=Trichophyton TaxID=5550 RepID=F2PMZ6_TRIEC|nr:WD repeat protein [Trichophyton tonsurans CBS 112818]EGE03264.1 WD repeat protein [Trichophyton equinum CBS 127.97]
MQTSNRDYFFQTTAQLENAERKREKSKNSNGSPIKLQSKILAIAADPTRSDAVFLAESAGTARQLILEVGCWDKCIWSWDVKTRKPGHKFTGHTDFVKAVVYVQADGRSLLISGGADAEVIIWDATAGTRLHVLKGHTHGIQCLAIDPIARTEGNPLTVFSSSSGQGIHSFTVPASLSDAVLSDPFKVHETSIYKIFFDEDGDLWTASADNIARCLTRQSGWKPETALEHPDYVKDIVVDETRGWVITACRDEEVRVWDRATGELHHTYSGHFEEVTGLLIVGSKVVSVSIDATVRQWPLDPREIQLAKAAEKQKPSAVPEPAPESMLTEEEERELDELLNDSS